MFGMEKKTKDNDSLFEFMQEYGTQEKKKEITKTIYDKVTLIKKMLRDGEDQEIFDKVGVILHGYIALKNVLEKIARNSPSF